MPDRREILQSGLALGLAAAAPSTESVRAAVAPPPGIISATASRAKSLFVVFERAEDGERTAFLGVQEIHGVGEITSTVIGLDGDHAGGDGAISLLVGLHGRHGGAVVYLPAGSLQWHRCPSSAFAVIYAALSTGHPRFRQSVWREVHQTLAYRVEGRYGESEYRAYDPWHDRLMEPHYV